MKPLIKIDLEKIIGGEKQVIIDLGCGDSKREGRIGIDKLDLPNVDIVADIDIEKGLSFLPDNSVDEIHSNHFFEHIVNFEDLMREVVRVLKKDGRVYITVPHFSNPYFYSDYTHFRFFGLYTFYYFVDKKYQLARKVPDFYSDIRIKIVSQRLIFKSPFKCSYVVKKLFELIINSHRIIQEFYEEYLCYVFPCYEVKIVFVK